MQLPIYSSRVEGNGIQLTPSFLIAQLCLHKAGIIVLFDVGHFPGIGATTGIFNRKDPCSRSSCTLDWNIQQLCVWNRGCVHVCKHARGPLLMKLTRQCVAQRAKVHAVHSPFRNIFFVWLLSGSEPKMNLAESNQRSF